MLDPGIQSADDRIEWIFAHVPKAGVEDLRQSDGRRICHIEIERPVSNSKHPAVKAAPARSPSEPWWQMKRFPGNRPACVLPAIIGGLTHQGNLGKRRGKQVAADAGQSPAIPEDEEMIDERTMAVDRLQFGINSRIRRLGLAAAPPHLISFACASPRYCCRSGTAGRVLWSAISTAPLRRCVTSSMFATARISPGRRDRTDEPGPRRQARDRAYPPPSALPWDRPPAATSTGPSAGPSRTACPLWLRLR